MSVALAYLYDYTEDDTHDVPSNGFMKASLAMVAAAPLVAVEGGR